MEFYGEMGFAKCLLGLVVRIEIGKEYKLLVKGETYVKKFEKCFIKYW